MAQSWKTTFMYSTWTTIETKLHKTAWCYTCYFNLYTFPVHVLLLLLLFHVRFYRRINFKWAVTISIKQQLSTEPTTLECAGVRVRWSQSALESECAGVRVRWSQSVKGWERSERSSELNVTIECDDWMWRLNVTIECDNWTWQLNVTIERDNWMWQLNVTIERDNWMRRLNAHSITLNFIKEIKVDHKKMSIFYPSFFTGNEKYCDLRKCTITTFFWYISA